MKSQIDIEAISKTVESRVGEFFEGFVLVGFVEEQAVIIRAPANMKTNLALNQLLMTATNTLKVGDGSPGDIISR